MVSSGSFLRPDKGELGSNDLSVDHNLGGNKPTRSGIRIVPLKASR